MLPRKVETEHNNDSNIKRHPLLGAVRKALHLSASNTTSTNTDTDNAQVSKGRVSNGVIAAVVILIALLIAISVSTFYYIRIRRRKRLRNMVELGTASCRLEPSLVSSSSSLPSSTSSASVQETNDSLPVFSRVLSLYINPEAPRILDTVLSRSTSTKTKSSTTRSIAHSEETVSIFSKQVGEDGSIKDDERPPTVLSQVPRPQSSKARRGHVLKIINITPTDLENQSPNTALPPDDTDMTKSHFKQPVKGRMRHSDLPKISTGFGIKDAFKVELPQLKRESSLLEESSSLSHSESGQRNSLDVPSVRKSRMTTRSLTSPRKPRGARPIPGSTTGPLRPHSVIEFSSDRGN